MMHLFGIGQVLSPILQTMRQRLVAHLYISPFRQFFRQQADRSFSLSAKMSIVVLAAANFPFRQT